LFITQIRRNPLDYLEKWVNKTKVLEVDNTAFVLMWLARMSGTSPLKVCEFAPPFEERGRHGVKQSAVPEDFAKRYLAEKS